MLRMADDLTVGRMEFGPGGSPSVTGDLRDGTIIASSSWRDIATAPRDGTRVDLWADGHRFTDCLWGEWPDRSCWCSLVGIGVPAYPTHWMPIPGAPR